MGGQKGQNSVYVVIEWSLIVVLKLILLSSILPHLVLKTNFPFYTTLIEKSSILYFTFNVFYLKSNYIATSDIKYRKSP